MGCHPRASRLGRAKWTTTTATDMAAYGLPGLPLAFCPPPVDYDKLPLLAGLSYCPLWWDPVARGWLVVTDICVWCKVPLGKPHKEHCRTLIDAALGAMTSVVRTTAVGASAAAATRPPEQHDPLRAQKYASSHARRVSPGCPHLMGNCACDVPHYLRCDTMRDGLRCARGSGHYPPDQHVYKEPKNA